MAGWAAGVYSLSRLYSAASLALPLPPPPHLNLHFPGPPPVPSRHVISCFRFALPAGGVLVGGAIRHGTVWHGQRRWWSEERPLRSLFFLFPACVRVILLTVTMTLYRNTLGLFFSRVFFCLRFIAYWAGGFCFSSMQPTTTSISLPKRRVGTINGERRGGGD